MIIDPYKAKRVAIIILRVDIFGMYATGQYASVITGKLASNMSFLLENDHLYFIQYDKKNMELALNT